MLLWQSPLQLAVITRQPDLVRLLLSHGADPVTVFDRQSGDSLLHLATRSGTDACLYPLLCYWPQQTPSTSNYSEQWQSNVDRPNFEGTWWCLQKDLVWCDCDMLGNWSLLCSFITMFDQNRNLTKKIFGWIQLTIRNLKKSYSFQRHLGSQQNCT